MEQQTIYIIEFTKNGNPIWHIIYPIYDSLDTAKDGIDNMKQGDARTDRHFNYRISECPCTLVYEDAS